MTAAEAIQGAALIALTSYAMGEDAPEGTYLRVSAVQAGIETSTADPAPFIICYDFTTSQADTNSRVESAAVTLYFADVKPGQGDSAEIHHDATARMTLLKQRFFAALDAHPLVQISAMRATPFADSYAAKLDGVGVQFTLTVPAPSLVAACL